MLFVIQSIILCGVFTAIIMPLVLKDPLQQLFNYPPAIRERVMQLPQYRGRIPTRKKKLGLKLSAALLFIIILSAIVYLSGVRFFAPAFFYALGLWLVINWFDTIVLDLIIFCHGKRFRIPGTEDMVKEYESPWFHLVNGLKGSLYGVVVAALTSVMVFLLQSLI